MKSAVLERIEKGKSTGEFPREFEWTNRTVFHLDEARLRYARLRTLVRLREWCAGKITHKELEAGWESVFEAVPDSVELGWVMLTEALTPALWPYTPYVQSRGMPHIGGVNGYSALCLQFFNHLAEGATFRRCVECETRFVRHLGGSSIRSPHSRGEIRFCSKLCTDKAGSREYRRKRRARELRERGLSLGQIAEKMNESHKDVKGWLQD